MSPPSGVAVRTLTIVLALAGTAPAAAAKPRTLEITVVDGAGQALPSAFVVLADEWDPHGVDRTSATWSGSALQVRDGTRRPFERGSTVVGWVVAPGHQARRFSWSLRRRTEARTVALQALPLDPLAVPLPPEDLVGPLRRVLERAAAAIAAGDLGEARHHLGAVDRGRLRLAGEPFVQATLALYELRTLMAHAAWSARMEAVVAGDPDGSQARAAASARQATWDLATAWRDYAREAGRPSPRAAELCRLSSPRPDRCGG
jgi:hypothetical protein